MRIWWWWHVARIISLQKIFGLYGLKPHIVEISGDVTDAGRTTTQTREDSATQPMDCWRLSLANSPLLSKLWWGKSGKYQRWKYKTHLNEMWGSHEITKNSALSPNFSFAYYWDVQCQNISYNLLNVDRFPNNQLTRMPYSCTSSSVCHYKSCRS